MNDRASEGLGSLAALVQQATDNRLKELHTVMPGFIDSFDPATQTCSVQPAIKRVFQDGEALPLPLLTNVPLCFPNAGGFSITLPVKQGDECLIMFSERSIDNWFKFGELRPPNDRRFHDLSDGFVLMGIRSEQKVLPNYDPANLVLRSDDEAVSVSVKPASIDIVGNTNVAGNVSIVGDLDVDGKIDATGDITTTGGDVVAGTVSLLLHTHPYIGAGTASTPQVSGPPIP